MPSHDPSANGGIPERPDVLDAFLEPVDASELRFDEVPTVEVAVLPKPRSEFGTAFFWFALFATLFLGFFYAVAAIAKGDYSLNQKIIWGLLLALIVGGIGLAFAIYSACQKGFTFGKAFLWCVLFMVVGQVFPLVLVTICDLAFVHSGVDLSNPAWGNSANGQIFMQVVLLLGQAATILFSLMILRWALGREWKRKIALRLPNLEDVILIIIGMPALILVLNVLVEIVSPYLPSVKQFGISNVDELIKQTTTWPWGIAVLAVGIGPALGEELWCRGFLGQRLASRYGKWGCVLLSSFLFGLIHIEPPQAMFAFLMGIVFYLCYLASRSILVPMLMHLINNTLSVLDKSTTGRLPIANSLEIAYQSNHWLALAASFIVLITVGVIFYYSRVRIWAPEGAEVPSSLYPNVEHPLKTSANKAERGPMPAAAVGALIVAACLFGAVWFGL